MLVDIADSNTAGIGSVWLTRGRNTGLTIGTTATTSMWTTTVMDITCSTADIPVIALRSAFT
jgi:hypothetical protein